MKDDWEIFHKIYDASPVDKEKAHGWIQYKGTDICVDLRCECGHLGHHDGDFFYHYECPECERKWTLDNHIKLLPITDEQIKFIENHHIEFKGDTC